MNIRLTNRQGQHLAVNRQGLASAPVVMLSNSLGTDQSMWQAQVDRLLRDFQVITYDTRGHGQSDVMQNTSLQNLAEDVIDILDQLHIVKVHFCGISMGGMTALYLGLHYAERFFSITVANSAAKIWTTKDWIQRADTVMAHGVTDLVASTQLRWFSEYFDYQNNPLAQQAIQSLADTPALGYAEACRALAHADLQQEIKRISIPTLIIAGEYDPVTTVQDGEFMHDHIPFSQLVLLKASHLSNIEQPEKFTQEFIKFIS